MEGKLLFILIICEFIYFGKLYVCFTQTKKGWEFFIEQFNYKLFHKSCSSSFLWYLLVFIFLCCLYLDNVDDFIMIFFALKSYSFLFFTTIFFLALKTSKTIGWTPCLALYKYYCFNILSTGRPYGQYLPV